MNGSRHGQVENTLGKKLARPWLTRWGPGLPIPRHVVARMTFLSATVTLACSSPNSSEGGPGGLPSSGGTASTSSTAISGAPAAGDGLPSTAGAMMTTGGKNAAAGASATGGTNASGAGTKAPNSGSDSGSGGSGGGTDISGGTASTEGGRATGGTASGSAGAAGTSAKPEGTGGASLSAGCGVSSSLKSGRASISVSGAMREYVLRIPDDYDPDRAYKLVFAFHARGGNASQVTGSANNDYYGLYSRAQGSAIFVGPEGLDAGWRNTDGRDIAFVKAMLAEFNSKLCVDQQRIFSVGFSFGGMMSDAIGCAMADVFRAIAPMAGPSPIRITPTAGATRPTCTPSRSGCRMATTTPSCHSPMEKTL